ncbi:MAG: PQQ-binding-like beta-propeller repeat protein [Planctomycetes bacterium]|nr:PQQ-binding-like beta-propeller repeat protein [Planctomycetota bacterium]
MLHPRRLSLLSHLILGLALSMLRQPARSDAADWPQWRCDAGHTASTSEELPQQLHLQWVRKYTPRQQAWQDPVNDYMMTFDKTFEPVVQDGLMFIGFNDSDKLVALDAASGKELWRFYADGPIRMAPAAHDGRVLFTSDDGWLYCLEADTGKLAWKFRGGPGDQKCLGNGRVISCWPARGGPVIRDGKVYFAASIWPFMGVFIHALDVKTGKQVWINDTTGSRFNDQPHVTVAYGTVAPQGQLAATADRIIVPGGRSVPAGLDRATGEFKYFRHAGDGAGFGSFVVADDNYYFARSAGRKVLANQVAEGKPVEPTMWAAIELGEPVLDRGAIYVAEEGKIRSIKLVTTPEEAKRLGIDFTKKPLPVRHTLWEIEADGSGDLIKAGNRLYAAGKKSITAIDVSAGPTGNPQIAWTMPVEEGILRLLAASDRLFAVTLDGRILAYGNDKPNGDAPFLTNPKPPLPWSIDREEEKMPLHAALTQRFLRKFGKHSGYFLTFGKADKLLLMYRLVEDDPPTVIAVDTDAKRVDDMRRYFDLLGCYGKKLSIHVGDPATYKAPSYFATYLALDDAATKACADDRLLAEVYRSVRPHGGILSLSAAGVDREELARQISRGLLPGATWDNKRPDDELAELIQVVPIRRRGPPPGAGDWTHQYGNIANTLKSDDKLVKLPLGVLWFGGSSHVDVLPRHGNGPPQQVVGGRLIIQGLDNFAARDVYTGRVLWKVKIDPKELGTFGVYYDQTLNPDPLSGKSQGHIAGARMRGTNFVATEDSVYLALGNKCRVLNAATGETVRDIEMPNRDGKPASWGFIGVYENILLGGQGFADYRSNDKDLNKVFDQAASRALVAFDRKTGQKLWQVDARHGFPHNGIVAGKDRIHLLDIRPESKAARDARRGKPAPADQRLLTVEAKTGKTLWERDKEIGGVWLSLSVPRDILVLSTDSQPHRWSNQTGLVPWQGKASGITAFSAADGNVVWENKDFAYNGPLILHNDTIFSNVESNWREKQNYSGAISLLTGKPSLRTNPLTGLSEPWRITRNYGCNAVIASEHLMTLRSGTAAYFDLETGCGTGSLGGFKSSCTSNLIAAGGVLNAPDYTRACSCAFQNQTSLAMIHMPDIQMEQWTAHYEPLQWSNSDFRPAIEVGGPIRRLGINLGAPGDRVAPDGTLWLEYPLTRNYQGGDSYNVPITMDGDPTNVMRRHAAAISGPLPWVGASQIRDLKHLFVDLGTDNLKNGGQPARYTVKLYFTELEEIPAKMVESGQDRRFDVLLQGKPVLTDFSIQKEAGGINKTLVKTFENIEVRDALKLSFRRGAKSKYPAVLSGVEIVENEPFVSNR